jgi:hypothetical protein
LKRLNSEDAAAKRANPKKMKSNNAEWHWLADWCFKNENESDKNLITLDVTLDTKWKFLSKTKMTGTNVRLVYKTFRPELCMFFFR